MRTETVTRLQDFIYINITLTLPLCGKRAREC